MLGIESIICCFGLIIVTTLDAMAQQVPGRSVADGKTVSKNTLLKRRMAKKRTVP
jgi:hypothetical protein